MEEKLKHENSYTSRNFIFNMQSFGLTSIIIGLLKHLILYEDIKRDECR